MATTMTQIDIVDDSNFAYINITELVEEIRTKFTPFAFTCGCNGNDPDCAQVLSSLDGNAQFSTVERICKLIEGKV